MQDVEIDSLYVIMIECGIKHLLKRLFSNLSILQRACGRFQCARNHWNVDKCFYNLSRLFAQSWQLYVIQRQRLQWALFKHPFDHKRCNLDMKGIVFY